MTHTMNTTYRSKKRVTRMMARCSQGVAKVYPRCTQALGRLMSKLRSSLGAAWEQPGSSLEYAYSMLMTTFLRPFSCKRAELERRLAANEITARCQRDYGSSLTRLRLMPDEITARHIPAPDAHSRKQQRVGTDNTDY